MTKFGKAHFFILLFYPNIWIDPVTLDVIGMPINDYEIVIINQNATYILLHPICPWSLQLDVILPSFYHLALFCFILLGILY